MSFKNSWLKYIPFQILAEDQFSCIEKIKTTGYTYMAASGLTANTVDMTNHSHVTRMADFALRLKDQLDYVNVHSFNNFKIRVGKDFIFNFKKCSLHQ